MCSMSAFLMLKDSKRVGGMSKGVSAGASSTYTLMGGGCIGDGEEEREWKGMEVGEGGPGLTHYS